MERRAERVAHHFSGARHDDECGATEPRASARAVTAAQRHPGTRSHSVLHTMLISLLLTAPALADTLPEIRYHAIVEAPVNRVWVTLAGPRNVSKWLCTKTDQWIPVAGRPYRITLTGGTQVEGRITKADRPKLLQLDWPAPASTLTLEVQPLDDHLTMITLTHGDWQDDDETTRKRREDFEHRWRAALMKLHRLFPPSLVETRVHRPQGAKGLFIERSLLVNGDFEFAAPGKYEGAALGWETNTAKSSPQAHAVDGKVRHTVGRHTRGRSQCIKHPPDWTNFAVQQFTSHLEPMIEPGKRYRLTAWVKADGIRNPAGWYKIGLWCTDPAGRPIGEPIKNEKRTDANGSTILNHDWTKITIEATAPPGAARAVVILAGHWDDAGTVWYDDITLWQAEKPPTTRK